MFPTLLVQMLFATAHSARSLALFNSLLRGPHKRSKCALFCHLPTPFGRWYDFLEDRCDQSRSLFIHPDANVLHELEDASLSTVDLFRAAYFLEVNFGNAYRVLVADLDVARDFLFGQAVDVGEIYTQGKTVQANETAEEWDMRRCITVTALDEIAVLHRSLRLANPWRYEDRRHRCIGNDRKRVTHEQVEDAKLQAERSLPRTKKFASHGGRKEVLAKLAALLPPAPVTCGSPEECLESRFVNATTWDPPENLAQSYDRVIFVDCEYRDFEGKAVESALKLLSPGGEIIINGPTPEDLKNFFGITPFEKLINGWTRSWHDDLTVFSELSERRNRRLLPAWLPF